MPERKPLYLTIAHRSAEAGDAARAIVTIVNALRNNPQFLDRDPEAIDLLAEILIPGFEEEIHRLEACYPSFGPRLYDALAAHGKVEFAHALESSFGTYCIERMKAVMPDSAEDAARYVSPGSRLAVESGFFEPVSASRPVVESGFYRTVAPSRPVVESGFYRPVSEPRPVVDSAFYRSVSRGRSAFPVGDGELPVVTRERTYAPAAMVAMGDGDDPAMESDPLLPDVWIPSLHRGNGLRYEKHEFCSHNTDTCAAGGVRRFDRLRRQTQAPSAPEVVELPEVEVNRAILDFDDNIRNAPKSALFESAKTPFRTYAEEAAQWLELTRDIPVIHREPVKNPLELVAETTHELSETPSVEPYSVRHPLRFHLGARGIATCVFACVFCVMVYIAWQTLEPRLVQSAMTDFGRAYIEAVERDGTAAGQTMEVRHIPLVSRDWESGYRRFLAIWQWRYSQDAIVPDVLEGAEGAAWHAGEIMLAIAQGRSEDARSHYDAVPSSVWRTQPCFRTWSEAQLAAADHDVRTAAQGYAKLLHSPLAPFALTEMGLLSLDDPSGEVLRDWLEAYTTAETVPAVASCLHAAVMPEAPMDVSDSPEGLRSPYAEFCAIGRIRNAIVHGRGPLPHDLAVLESAPPLAVGDHLRLEALVASSLYSRDVVRAVDTYRNSSLLPGDPRREHLLDAVLSDAMATGDWTALRILVPGLPSELGYLAAAHIVDSRLGDVGIARQEALIRYGAPLPEPSISSYMDEVYVHAEAGRYGEALRMTQAIVGTHPEYVEPLLVQAMILSRMGRAGDAVAVLEQAVYSGMQAAPLIVLSNLYRARARMPLNASGILLPWMHFSDESLESARCEVFWRLGDPRASSCIAGLSRKTGVASRTGWILRHLHRDKPTGKSADWAKASAGYLSFPGFYLQYARRLASEESYGAAIGAYTRALFDDRSTRNPAIIAELSALYKTRGRRAEGAQKFEQLIAMAERAKFAPELLGTLHYEAALLYQPELARSKSRRHLASALEYLGEQPAILRAYVTYYEAKGKTEQARIWRTRLQGALHRDGD